MVDVQELENHPTQSFYNPTSKPQKSSQKHTVSKFSIVAFFVVMIILAIVGILSFTLPLDGIFTTALEASDVQCTAYTIESEWAFAESLNSGKLSTTTINNLKDYHVLVGNLNGGTFTESTSGTVLQDEDGNFYTSQDFVDNLNSDTPNIKLYTAFTKSIPSCATLYNDEYATRKFKEVGTTRNNYQDTSDFDYVSDKIVEKGTNVTVDSVAKVKKTRDLGNGKTETYYEYDSITPSNTKNSTKDNLLNSLLNSGSPEAARAKANTLITAADQRSSKEFAAVFLECLEKTKAGDGNDEVHNCMNWFTTSATTQYVDNDGTVKTITGSPSESPSLSAILAGSKIPASAQYYANDYALTLTGDKSPSLFSAIKNTIASFAAKISGAITNFLTNGIQKVETSVLTPILPILDTSVLDNSSSNFKGIYGGQELWKGIVNLQGDLAAGAIPSSEENTLSYQKLNSKIIALNSTVDKNTKSPFDITSRHTFLGSIIYNLSLATIKNQSTLSLVQNSIASLIPNIYAEDNYTYYSDFDSCPSANAINASCTKDGIISRSFDAKLLSSNTVTTAEFQNYVLNNTYLDSSGNRKIKDGSSLSEFVILYGENKSPLSTFNPNIILAYRNHSSSVGTISNLASFIEIFLGTNDKEKALATGSAFVNSPANPYYEEYKYASIYVSYARTLSILQSHDPVSYNNFPLFEGSENPVLAYIDTYYSKHPDFNSQTANQFSFHTSNNHLIVFKVLYQTFLPDVIELRKYII